MDYYAGTNGMMGFRLIANELFISQHLLVYLPHHSDNAHVF